MKILEKTLISLLLWVLALLTVVPFLALVFLYRTIVSRVVPHVFNKVHKIVALTSSIFIVPPESKSAKTHLAICYGFKGEIEIEEMRNEFVEKVIRKSNSNGEIQWPELQQHIEHHLGYPFWKWGETFSVKNHIRMYEFSSIEKRKCKNKVGAQDIVEICERIVQSEFPPNRSPWEILVVPNFYDSPKLGDTDNYEGTILIFHYDHVLGDGGAIIEVFKALFDTSKFDSKNQGEISNNYFKQFFYSLYNTLQIYIKIPYFLYTECSNDVVQSNMWTRNKLKYRYNAAVTPTIPANVIKNIRRTKNVNFTTVVLSTLAKALERFLTDAGIEINDIEECQVTRALSTSTSTKLGNNSSVMRTWLPMHGNNQFEVVENTIKEEIIGRYPEIRYKLAILLCGLWNSARSFILDSNKIKGFIVSNLVWFDGDVSFRNKNTLMTTFILAKVGRGATGVAVSSITCYRGVRFVFEIDESIVPKTQCDAKILVDYYMEELESHFRSK